MTLEEIVKELAQCGLKKNREGEGLVTAFLVHEGCCEEERHNFALCIYRG